MSLEAEAQFLRRAIRAGVLDADKGAAALHVYSQLQKMGAKFSFGDFLVERGLLSNMGLAALETGSGQQLHAVSTLGDFELLELIGEGQNGAVFRARQKALDRIVALKILNANLASDTEGLRRFQNEARATARINHHNIVQGIDVGCDHGLNYFAMEFVDGGSVRSLLAAQGGALSEKAALNIAKQSAMGLRAAHSNGLLHGDLKPDNILLTKGGEVKLADMGISRFFAEKIEGKGADFWASPPYVAPEVIQGRNQDDDGRSDVYSLGATLFELLAGRPPYVANTPQDVMRMHLQAPIPDIQAFRRDVTIHTAALIKKMLAKVPSERVPSAASVAEAITRIMTHQEAPAAPVRAPESPPAPAPAPAARTPIRRPLGTMNRPGAPRPGARPGQKHGAARFKPRGRR